MINNVARGLAIRIKQQAPEHPASLEVLRFALEAVINGVLIVGLSLIGSLLLGTTLNTVIILISFALLRQLSGGIHFKSAMTCIAVSTTGVLLLSLIEMSSESIMVINGINIVLVLLFAPSRIEEQTRIQKKYYPLLRILATLVVSTNFIVNSPSIAITFFVQCCTLIRIPSGRRG